MLYDSVFLFFFIYLANASIFQHPHPTSTRVQPRLLKKNCKQISFFRAWKHHSPRYIQLHQSALSKLRPTGSACWSICVGTLLCICKNDDCTRGESLQESELCHWQHQLNIYGSVLHVEHNHPPNPTPPHLTTSVVLQANQKILIMKQHLSGNIVNLLTYFITAISALLVTRTTSMHMHLSNHIHSCLHTSVEMMHKSFHHLTGLSYPEWHATIAIFDDSDMIMSYEYLCTKATKNR